MLRTLINTEPVRTLAVLGAALTIAQAVWLGAHGGPWPSGEQWLGMGSTAFTAALAWWRVRAKTTSLARPRDNDGNPLIAAVARPADPGAGDRR